jgi:hypothetical protein
VWDSEGARAKPLVKVMSEVLAEGGFRSQVPI